VSRLFWFHLLTQVKPVPDVEVFTQLRVNPTETEKFLSVVVVVLSMTLMLTLR
jgi:hypothetical protein